MERLRAAMRATEPDLWESLDLDAVMRQGRSLRRRRRAAAGGAVVLSAALVVVGVTVGVRFARPPGQLPPPAPAVSAPTTSAPVTSTPIPGTESRKPIGEVVSSGIRYGTEERVFYFVPVDLPAVPDVTIGLVAGRRLADGTLIADYLVNDVAGSDRRPGFHEIGYESSPAAPTYAPVPTFGYFVGPADGIIGTVDGRRVTARLARWSMDTDVVIFWFDPQTVKPGRRLDGISARDTQGRPL
ncbi:hypothetical protein GCM10029963_14170 [Micromonospora andamanensis]|uniref:Uncharacterized protein n=1 Tax=Micromonospora andamanensis TaxID=1287068 RepID=A0ABQ4HZ61_9ACTN|nr:hypothetical protein Van01_41480 [Micromonospora andamanensis]GIJ38764.1 hypothetical protein Vwe01_20890 [Micromonospora andamanensis]